MEMSCVVIVGKPGAGKSSIGGGLARCVGGAYLSLGGFMREVMHIPDPHIGVDKNIVYDRLLRHLASGGVSGTLVLDCHPYPEGDLEALFTFMRKPSVRLRAVIHVEADDEVVLRRLERRPRPGQTNEERLKYFNDNATFIDALLKHPCSIRVENNEDFDDMGALLNIVEDISRRL